MSDEQTEALRLEWEAVEVRLGVALKAPGLDPEHDASPELVHERIFPFLDATGLVLSGGDLQIFFELRVDGKSYLFSWREWGGYQAEWMNLHFCKGLGKFDYLDFYMDTNTVTSIHDYNDYLLNLRRIRGA